MIMFILTIYPLSLLARGQQDSINFLNELLIGDLNSGR